MRVRQLTFGLAESVVKVGEKKDFFHEAHLISALYGFPVLSLSRKFSLAILVRLHSIPQYRAYNVSQKNSTSTGSQWSVEEVV